MKFSLSWLSDHLDTDLPLDALVDKMTMLGLEVEEVIDPAEALKDFSVAVIKEAEQHPDADRLKVCRVDTKDGEMQVVCGAPNARAGLVGVFAPVGAYVPGIDLTLKKAKIRGVESHGMMCSGAELLLSDDHDGIIDLQGDFPVGAPAAEALGATDAVIDFEVTPNRPDWLGVRGIARDLAAAGVGDLSTDSVVPVPGSFPCPIDVTLSFPAGAENACPLFTGRLIRGVKNGPSPDWLRQKLETIGLKSISTLVDITNLMSYDRARPLHVFDADKLKGDLVLRLAEPGEKFIALDEETYDLGPEMCVIADDSGAISLGGVMGGLDSGCTDDTVNVFLESAYFDPIRTAQTGRDSGIQSDARYRFERGVDTGDVINGRELATALILELCGGEASFPVFAGQEPAAPAPVNFHPDRVERLTGIAISDADIERLLTETGFTVDKNGAAWTVTPPTWRPDVDGEADLVEDILRLDGFEKIPSTPLPKLSVVEQPKLSTAQNNLRVARHALAARGWTEAVTWSFCHQDDAALFSEGADALADAGLLLANPISADLDCMRPSLYPNLLRALQRNRDRGVKTADLYEVGPQYAGDQPEDQSQRLTGVQTTDVPRHWAGGGAPDVFSVKADAVALLAALGLAPEKLKTVAAAPAWYHPGRSGALCFGPKMPFAYFGELHPRVLKTMDVDGPVLGLEILFENLPKPKKKATKSKGAAALPDLSPLARDFAFVVAADVAAEAVLLAARDADKALIEEVRVFDVYEGEHVEAGKKSVAIEVVIQPREKTLSDEEIGALSEKIIAAVVKATGGTLRA